ncbi:retinal cone rhodopsin-sensitive cGMP 3',5'-cyclic phosphodiesterase subunit gamma-like [Corythoichthys intestinalis]|uniref:retinal cone rhodopsin-sensitive cGMP 3',5'-cyclic phosphodiesterase subunit gamma-like n=1 Tax=Corythoichthys intestinalis TaxID=161448 RepID=UPI0025A4F57E|nr:retinal cone rhodopsin-sensitive cGMP 3',5'-cyclic phosphodiesterase subunit gamma-like [Corythoichthys intestinalis]
MEMNGAAAETEGANVNPPKSKEKETRLFKSKAPKAGQNGFDDIPGIDSIRNVEVICPWEAFGDMELSDLAQFGIV